jgi:hypothetical protein
MAFDKSTIDHWSQEDVARFKRPEGMFSALGASASETTFNHLVARGDSWFDYLPGIGRVP